jgi:hypothetical protein
MSLPKILKIQKFRFKRDKKCFHKWKKNIKVKYNFMKMEANMKKIIWKKELRTFNKK